LTVRRHRPHWALEPQDEEEVEEEKPNWYWHYLMTGAPLNRKCFLKKNKSQQ
jgi:hypothetical protein